MRTNKPPSDDLLARAAELRAAGSNWETVAANLHRAADTVRKWPALYPDRWQAAHRDAEHRLVCETTAEAVLVLRRLLRSEDEKVRRDAARGLIDLRLELAKLQEKTAADAAPPIASEAHQLLAFLEGHTDDELARLAADLYPAANAAPLPDRPEALDGED